MKTEPRQDLFHQGEWYHRPVINEPTLVNDDGYVIIPSYVRLSEHPTAKGECLTANLSDPDKFKPAGWYVEYKTPGGTQQYRGFFLFREVKGPVETS